MTFFFPFLYYFFAYKQRLQFLQNTHLSTCTNFLIFDPTSYIFSQLQSLPSYCNFQRSAVPISFLVMGEILNFVSHLQISYLSQVCPSPAITGSLNNTLEIGQIRKDGILGIMGSIKYFLLFSTYIMQAIPPHSMKHQLANCAVKLSPHQPNLLALASSMNFGIVGAGKAQVYAMKDGGFQLLASLDEKEAVFDIAWTEDRPTVLLVGTGAGSIILWDFQKGPIWRLETMKQVQSLQCNYKAPMFVTAGMDGLARIGDLINGKFISTFQAHASNCYQASWNPHHESMWGTVGTDGLLKLWDLNSPNKNIANVKASQGQIMCCDFNKYEDMIITGSNDKTLRVWDLRNMSTPINLLVGHRYPIRRVKASPFNKDIIVSGSFDMTINVYNLQQKLPLVITHGHHSEFVTGLDLSLHEERMLASTSWDGRTLVWDYMKQQPFL